MHRSWIALTLLAAAGAIGAAAQVAGPIIGIGSADQADRLSAPASIDDANAGLRASPSLLPADGVPDVLVGPDNGSRAVRLLSGVDGSEIASGFPFGAGFTGGVRVAYGDVTGDGIPDPITAMGNGGGLVRLFDGATLTNVLNGFPFGPAFTGGVFVATGDVSGDGRADVVVAQGRNGGEVHVYNAADGHRLAAGAPFGPAYSGGVRVAAGDVNGDGRADVITGQASGGKVSVFDGAGPGTLVSGFPYGAGFSGGIFVAAGDVNADGRYDVIIAPGTGNGPVMVVDGQTLSLIANFPAYPAGFTGGVRVAAADLTGDGRADIITAPGPGGQPMLRVFDGATFTLAAQALAYEVAFSGGVFVATPTSSGRLRFTSASTTTFTIGEAGTFTVTTAGAPPATSVTQTGALPSGVTFTDNGDGTATLAGTPAAGSAGTYDLTFTATNGVGPDETQTFTLTIVDAPPRVTATTPADGATGVPIDSPLVVTFSEAVNVTPAAFSVQCPPGTPVAISVPTASPATQFTIDPTVDLPATTACTLRVVADQVTDVDADDPPDTLAADVMASFTTSACAAITVTPTTLVGGNVSVPYGPVTFTQVGGAAPITWSVSSGTVPPNLTLDPSTGVLSGTPTTTGSSAFTVTATAVSGCTGSVALTLNIAAGPNQAPSFAVGPDQTVAEDSGAQSVAPWATAISPGPADEAAQTVTFNVTGNTNPALFSVPPAVSPSGTLTYLPAADASGTATITIVLQDNGGTALGGVDTSAPQSFMITVNAVNDAPSFTKGLDQTVLENAAAQTVPGWATGISAGPADEAGQTLTFVVTDNTNPGILSAGPAVSATGELTFTPAPNAAGSTTITLTLQDNGGTALGGIDTSAPQTFTITLTGVNTAPSFTAGPNQTVAEDSGPQSGAWATAISPGPADEAAQTVAFNVTGNTNPALFSVVPTVSPTGVLSYTPAANANGTATITLTLQDDGGTADGGVDTSAPQTFTITVNAVNDAPSFTVGLDQTVTENAPPQTVGGWATAISAGPADEAGQTLTFAVTNNTNPTLFSAGPAVSAAGELTYTLASNTSGAATITLTLQDNGGTALGGVDTSAPQSFVITVNPINSAPSFTLGPNQTVGEDSGAQVVSPWATAISAGPPDEASQTLTFNITGNTNPGLFLVAPSVSPAGVLSYTPAGEASGFATITLTLSDDGGTAGGGVDTSAPQNFTITVNAVNDQPSFVGGGNVSSAEDAGLQSFAGWATGISAGPGEGGQTLTFNVTGNTNPALFAAGGGPAVSPAGALTYTSAVNAFGSSDITVVLQDNGGTAGGGVDTSAPVTFTVTVTPVNDAPAVANETFDILGNTELRVDFAGGTTPHTEEATTGVSAVKGVLDNDSDPENDPFAVTAISGCADVAAPFDCTLAGGAVLHVEADGAFTFIPAPAATTASFTYTATDTPTVGVAASTNGTVTFAVIDMIWYVDGNVAGPGNGTSADPFNSFTATNLNDVGGAGDLDNTDDYIFVYDSTIAGGIVLEQGEHLIGEFAGLSLNRNLNGNGAPTNLVAAGGSRTVLTNGAGNAISMSNAVPAEVRGFALTSTGGDAINLTTNGVLPGVSTLVIANNQISASSAEGIDVALTAGTSGTLTLQVQGNVWNAANTHTGNAIDITRAAGNLNLDISGNFGIKSNTGAGIFVDGGNIANTTITSFSANIVHGDTGGAGVSIQNATFDAVPGGGLNSVNGGTLSIGADGNGVGTTALSIAAAQGTLAFSDLLAYGANGLNLVGTGSGLTVTVTPLSSGGTSVVKSTSGKALQTNATTIDLQPLEFVSSGPDAGVSLTTTAGIFGTPTGASITKASGAGTAFAVASSSVTVNYAGTLNVTSGSGVGLASNTGATSFTGQLTLNTGANPAFSATGASGTVIATHTANTLATTTATALNVSGPDIGVGGLVFRSIASNGAASGIILANTGTTAGLTVSGTGVNDSGGVIQNSTGDAVQLTSTRSISLSEMRLFNSGQSHIDGATVNGLTLNGVDTDLSVGAGILGNGITNLAITGGTFHRGGAGAEPTCNINGVEITNLLGTSTVTGATFTRSNTIQFHVNNNATSGSLDTLTVSGTNWNTHTGPCSGDHLSVNADTGGNFKLVTTGASGENNFQGSGIGVQATAGGSGAMQASITGVQTSGNTAGVAIAASATSNIGFNVFDNNTGNGTGFSGTGSVALILTCTTSGTCQGAFSNNSITHTAGTSTNAMQVVVEGDGSGIVTVANNTVSGNFQRGFHAQQRAGSNAGDLSLSVTNNSFTGTDVNGLQGMNFETSASGDAGIVNTMCLNLASNTTTMAGGLTTYRLVSRAVDVFRLQNFTGDGSQLADLQNWVTTVKSNSGTPVAASIGAAFQTSASCATPTLPTP